jgi:hypothetical protein
VYSKGVNMDDNKLKEYVLRIIYNSKTGEIEHLSEFVDLGYSLDIDGETVHISKEMGEFLEAETDCQVLGIS